MLGIQGISWNKKRKPWAQTKVLNVTNRDIDGYFLKGGGTVWNTVKMCVCELCCVVIRPEINLGLLPHMMYFIQRKNTPLF